MGGDLCCTGTRGQCEGYQRHDACQLRSLCLFHFEFSVDGNKSTAVSALNGNIASRLWLFPASLSLSEIAFGDALV